MQKYFLDESKNNIAKPFALIAAGLMTGFLSGFFGGGGGMLAVPALALIMNLSEKQAHATAIAVILPVTAVSATVYFLRGVSVGEGFAPTVVGVVLGGLAGAALLKTLPPKIIGIIFYGVMIAAGIKMLMG